MTCKIKIWIGPSSMACLLLGTALLNAQTDRTAPAPEGEMEQRVRELSIAVSKEASALAASQQEIERLRQQVSALQVQLATMQSGAPGTATPNDATPDSSKSQLDAFHEQQDIQKSELATLDQAKVESASRFPVRLTGLILMNGFVNTGGTDSVQAPTMAVAGAHTTGLTLRQTVLGLDARGPHLFGGTTSADVRIDFFGNSTLSTYQNPEGLLRLRTAHGEFNRNRTRAFLEVDRPILSPNVPTSLTAVAQPALAWSGNLWNWLPQLGVDQNIELGDDSHLKLSAAIADVPNPPGGAAAAYGVPSSDAERSRWPASELHLGYTRHQTAGEVQFGIGGYFSPHVLTSGLRYDAWAGTFDLHLPLSSRLEASGSVYRGAGLGGLGAGAFKDYVHRNDHGIDNIQALDDVGGWAQLKARASPRLEFNAAYGIDNAFVGELRGYIAEGSPTYQNLARNSTFFTNVIYSPTAYTLFTFEYRRLDSSPATGLHATSGVYGAAAAYRF